MACQLWLLIVMQNPPCHEQICPYMTICIELPGLKSALLIIVIALIIRSLGMEIAWCPDFLLLSHRERTYEWYSYNEA